MSSANKSNMLINSYKSVHMTLYSRLIVIISCDTTSFLTWQWRRKQYESRGGHGEREP